MRRIFLFIVLVIGTFYFILFILKITSLKLKNKNLFSLLSKLLRELVNISYQALTYIIRREQHNDDAFDKDNFYTKAFLSHDYRQQINNSLLDVTSIIINKIVCLINL